MRRDCLALLGNTNVAKGKVMSKWERQTRREMRTIVESMDDGFQDVVNGEEVLPEDSNDTSQDGFDGNHEGRTSTLTELPEQAEQIDEQHNRADTEPKEASDRDVEREA
ncbi:MAG: hypothetical protein M1827_000639 [Pycnora praestabilis]|nr:MAG: hypothetical protein M1827_000639 [Pycnora praestabilis]